MAPLPVHRNKYLSTYMCTHIETSVRKVQESKQEKIEHP